MGEDRGWWVDQEILKQRDLPGLLLHLHPSVDEEKSQRTTMKRLSTCISSDCPSGFLIKRTSVALLNLWVVDDYSDLGTPCPRNRFHHLGPSPMGPNELWTCPDDGAAMAQAHGCERSSCGSVRRGRGGDRYSQRRS